MTGDTRVARSGQWQRRGRPSGPRPYVALEIPPTKDNEMWAGNGTGGTNFYDDDEYGNSVLSRYSTNGIGPKGHVGYDGNQTDIQSTVVGTEAGWCLGTSVECNVLTIRPNDFAGITAGTYNSQIDSLVDSFTDATQESIINFWMEIDGYIRGRSGYLYNKTVTTRQIVGNVATLTFGYQHWWQVGDTVVVASMTNSAYNGTYTLTARTSTTVSYALTGSEGSTANAAGTVTQSGTPSTGAQTAAATAWRGAAIAFGDRVHTRLTATGRPRTGKNSIRVSINTTQTAYEPDGAPTYGHGTSFPYNTHFWDGSTSGTSGNMWGAIDLVTHNLYSGDGIVATVGFSNGNVNDFQTRSQNYFEALTPIAAGKQAGILEMGCVEAGFNGNANNSGWTLTKPQWIEAVMDYAITKNYFIVGHYDYPNGTMWQYNTSDASMNALKANVLKGRLTV